MNYTEAMKSKITRLEDKIEIKKHNLEFRDFINECGDKSEYIGCEILNWLGY